jgi:hypothetical protein
LRTSHVVETREPSYWEDEPNGDRKHRAAPFVPISPVAKIHRRPVQRTSQGTSPVEQSTMGAIVAHRLTTGLGPKVLREWRPARRPR